MKDSDIKQTLRQFEKVWPRVTGREDAPPSAPPKKSAADTLAEMIGAEAAAEQRYLCMAQRSMGANAAALRRLAAGSRGLVKKLQAEYYLRTGDSRPAPRRAQEKCRALGETLRLAWLSAGSAEGAYRAAVGRADDDSLRELFREAAELKQSQRALLRELARRLMR